MKEKLNELLTSLQSEVKEIKTEAEYLNLKSKYLGKKSELSQAMSTIKDMTTEEKKENGPLFHKTKTEMEAN